MRTPRLGSDIVGKEHHLTDPAWLLRVGVQLELLTCLGIIEAVRGDIGDLLDADERAAYESSDIFARVRAHLRPDAWRDVWRMRRIAPEWLDELTAVMNDRLARRAEMDAARRPPTLLRRIRRGRSG